MLPKNHPLVLGFIMVLVLSLPSVSLAATYGGGSGTAEEPYEIWTPEQMNTIGLNPGDWGKYFKLMDNIDMSVYIGTEYNIIGTSTSPFTGTFDGDEHSISNLTYTTTEIVDYVGLFGYVSGYTATIKNLGVENVSLSTGGKYIGGLVGSNSGSITDCFVSGSVSGFNYVGGLVGSNANGASIMSCYATSSVSGSGYVGGLVGYNSSYDVIKSCYATGSVTGSDSVGGLVGSNANGASTIMSCYATGSVTGSGSKVGGLVGYSYGAVTSCYSTGNVTGTGSYVGGLVGQNESHEGAITSCFWDMQTSGQPGSGSGKGLTTEQMKTLSIFQNAGWADKGWVMNDGADCPRLDWEDAGGVPIPSPQAIPLSGDGTAEDPYLISTAEEFSLLSWYSNVLNKHITLTANLDLSGITPYPIGDLGPFTGMFDGNGHTISNAVIEQPGSDYVGLFGSVGIGGQINNLGVQNAIITGRNCVGTLAGINMQRSTITLCYANGSAKGSGDFIGGLVGNNDRGCIINCFAASSVNGNRRVGGLSGRNLSGSIMSCYATGSVTGGSKYVGGLVGENWEGTVTTSFWDIQTSGRASSAGGKGLTTEQMKTMSNFQNSGWDFVGESANGLNDYWQMEANEYPHFTIHTWTLAGDGTVTHPYVISTPSDLGKVWLRPTACFRLNNNIDLSGISWSSSVVPRFSGVFDGQGFAVSHLTINLPEYIYMGLFGRIDSGSQLRNLRVESISNTGQDYVGGLAGLNSGSIISCSATGEVSGPDNYDWYVGGLVGDNSGSITASYATGEVIGYYCVGGLVGHSSGSITSSYATGEVNGYQYVGGLVGSNGDQQFDGGGSITFCYATDSVIGSDNYVGGLVGDNSGLITSSYATGEVSGSGNNIFGLAGTNRYGGMITACFWDIETSGKNKGVDYGSSGGVTGKTTAEMQTLATFTSAGWDFLGESTNGTADIWRMCTNDVDYPRLSWEYSQGGDFDCPNGVDLNDLLYFATRWLATTIETIGSADPTFDGRVDLSDLAILSKNWLKDMAP